MDSQKLQYVGQIRANTAYPVYRAMIGIITLLGYIMAGLTGLAAVVSGLMAMGNSLVGGLIVAATGLVGAVMMGLVSRFWQEAAQILADMGDSILEHHSRN